MSEKELSPVAKNLKKLRLQNGFTHDDIATILHLTRSAYSYYESGRSQPDLYSLKTLADLYNVNLDVFLMEEREFTRALADPESVKQKSFQATTTLDNLSKEERKMVALYRISKPSERRKALIQLNKVADEKK